MKRKIFSILLTLVLVLSFSLVTAVPAVAVDPISTFSVTGGTYTTTPTGDEPFETGDISVTLTGTWDTAVVGEYGVYGLGGLYAEGHQGELGYGTTAVISAGGTLSEVGITFSGTAERTENDPITEDVVTVTAGTVVINPDLTIVADLSGTQALGYPVVIDLTGLLWAVADPIDLEVNDEEPWKAGAFTFENILPGGEPMAFDFKLHNVGSDPGILTFSMSVFENDMVGAPAPNMTADQFASLIYVEEVHYQFKWPADPVTWPDGYIGSVQDDLPNWLGIDFYFGNNDGKVSLYEICQAGTIPYDAAGNPLQATAEITYFIIFQLGASLNPFEAGGVIQTGVEDNSFQGDGISVTITATLKQVGDSVSNTEQSSGNVFQAAPVIHMVTGDGAGGFTLAEMDQEFSTETVNASAGDTILSGSVALGNFESGAGDDVWYEAGLVSNETYLGYHKLHNKGVYMIVLWSEDTGYIAHVQNVVGQQPQNTGNYLDDEATYPDLGWDDAGKGYFQVPNATFDYELKYHDVTATGGNVDLRISVDGGTTWSGWKLYQYAEDDIETFYGWTHEKAEEYGYAGDDDLTDARIVSQIFVCSGTTETFTSAYDNIQVNVNPYELAPRVLNVDTNKGYTAIQLAINAPETDAGDTISVAAGTYEEDLSIDATKTGLELVGNDATKDATIKGVANVPIGDWPLAVPNIEILADGVKIHGFTIEGPDYVADHYASGLVLDGLNIEIYSNDFVTTSAETVGELAHAITTYSLTAIPDANPSGLNVHHNTFVGSGAIGSEFIYVCPHVGTGSITVDTNQFSGSVYTGATFESGKVSFTNNDPISNDTESSGLYGVRFMDSEYGTNGSYGNIVIAGNDISGFAKAIRVGNGSYPDTSEFIGTISSNILTGNELDVWGRNGNHLVVVNNTMASILNGNLDTVVVAIDATNNWWGHSSGPAEGAVVGEVDVNPWLLVKGGDTYDKTLALNVGWSIVSPDKELDSWIAVDAHELQYAYAYTEVAGELVGGFITTFELDPVTPMFIKTEAGGGIGFNYVEDSWGMFATNLEAGWNLIGIPETTATTEAVLSPLRFGGNNEVALATLANQGDFNTSDVGSFYRAMLSETDWDGLPSLSAFDGYWAYMNVAKEFGVVVVQ